MITITYKNIAAGLWSEPLKSGYRRREEFFARGARQLWNFSDKWGNMLL